MKKSQIPIYQAAASAALALRQNRAISEEVVGWLASHQDVAKLALKEFGATRLLRQIAPTTSTPKTLPSGRTLLFYKAPLPGEQQARLSYEYLLSEFQEYLQRRALTIVLSESDAHVLFWLPNDADLDLTVLWQAFMKEMTSSAGFSRGFGLVMNASKLTDRGFSTLETPLVSESHPQAVAAFYLANLRNVEGRIERRQSRIVTLKAEKDEAEGKKLEQDRAMQEKELEKYRSDFARIFGKQLRDEQEIHKELQAIESELDGADKAERKKLTRQRDKLLGKLSFDARVSAELNALYEADPFVFMERLREHEEFAGAWCLAEAQSKRYANVAAEQLNTARGDIYAKIIWETCQLLFGRIEITPVEPLLSETPFVWGTRQAGDNQNDFCYACGRLVDKENRYRSRRLLFESPEQRTQSGGSSGPVNTCTTCAALSLLSPIKFTDDTLVIRFEEVKTTDDTGVRQDVSERVRQGLEQQALNELGASAGRYVNLSCTEKTSDGTPASQRLGQKQYAVAKLASLYPPELLRSLEAFLYHGGQEIALPRSVLVGTALLSRLYDQRIREGGDINLRLGEVVRLLEKGAFVAACYRLTKQQDRVVTPFMAGLEQGTELYVRVLKEEKTMAQQADVIKDVHALIGLLMPFCRQLVARTDLKLNEDERWREIGKLIQSVDRAPTVFSYTSAKTVGNVGYLVRDSNNYFVYDQAKRLFDALEEKYGAIPAPKISSAKASTESEANNIDEDDSSNDVPKLRVTSDLIAQAYAHFNDIYSDEFTRKDFFYQVRLGLLARFPKAI